VNLHAQGVPRQLQYLRELLTAATSEEAGGVVQWVRINLTVAGIAPYITSKDPTAVSQGWQYRQRRVADVEVNTLRLPSMEPCSVLNPLAALSGDLADAVNPVVADHTISHMWLDRYLLWFDDQLTPHLGPNKTTEAELAMAKWGSLVW
jgi:hypothetical protein